MRASTRSLLAVCECIYGKLALRTSKRQSACTSNNLTFARPLNEEAGYKKKGNWPIFRDLLVLGNGYNYSILSLYKPKNDLHLVIPHNHT